MILLQLLSRTEDGETVTYTLGQGDRLAAWTGGSYEYDVAGCVTRITRGADTWDLAWNGQRQLVSVATNGAFAESYQYDALGRRVSTTKCRVDVKHDGDLACSQIHMVGAPSYEYDNGMVHHKILEFHPANFNWPWYDAIELELQVVVPPANHVSEVVSATLVVRENFPIR